MAEYKHHHHHHHHLILIALVVVVVVVVLVVSNYTRSTVVVVSNYTTTNTAALGGGSGCGCEYNDPMNNSTEYQKEKLALFVRHLYPIPIDLSSEEQQDRGARRLLATAALNPDPTSFLFLVRRYYENTYMINPETKKLVPVYVDPRLRRYLYCRKCPRPAPITEPDWRRYEAAVKRSPDYWITPLDVYKCRLWLAQNPNPL